MIVDAHVHVSDLWYEPVEILLAQMKLNGVDRAVLVQLGGQTDNSYQEQCVRNFPGLFASVVAVPVNQPDVISQLRMAKNQGAVGVRLKASFRSSGRDSLAVWREAESLGLVVSCIAHSEEVLDPAFSELVRAVPDLQITLEHLAESRRQNPSLTEERATALYQAIAPHQSVYLKIHGLGEASPRKRPLADPPFAATTPAPAAAYRILGADRLMWGSDFPPVSGREGYCNALKYTREALRDQGMTPAEEASIFGGLAAKLFRLQD